MLVSGVTNSSFIPWLACLAGEGNPSISWHPVCRDLLKCSGDKRQQQKGAWTSWENQLCPQMLNPECHWDSEMRIIMVAQWSGSLKMEKIWTRGGASQVGGSATKAWGPREQLTLPEGLLHGKHCSKRFCMAEFI